MIFAAIADWADSKEYPVTFMCAELGVSIAVAAMAFNYSEPLIDVTVPGMVSPREITEAVSAFTCGLTRPQLESIAEAGRIDAALLGGPDFLTSWPADRRPSLPDLQARWAARPEPTHFGH